MNPSQITDEVIKKLAAPVEHFRGELAKLRTGRAHPSMLDSIMVEAYGTPMPLIQVATVAVPDAQLIQITPFDPNNLQAIATAIRNNASLGLNPSDDGRVVRVPIPSLSEERRRELAKQVGQKQEEAIVSLRNIRRDAMDAVDAAKKAKQLGEDEAKRLSGQVDEAVAKARTEIETAAKVKETEIMTV